MGSIIKNRLLVVNEEELLAGFRKRPGKQDWIGEHVGKFLHAATLAWVNTGDPELKAKIDRVAAELIKCQDADGYLGTYLPEKHWTSWDVWIHKYDLIGLLTYHQYTGDASALAASRKIGDLLVNTFGPGKKSIIAAGTHVGMAATSVLEPIVLLHRLTGDERYLDFAKYIVAAYDEPNGPKIVKTLTETKSVSKTANGKAYEMMSNLVGLCELARAAGDKTYLTPVVNAWEDVVAHQLYITGTVSRGEHFGPDYDLPNGPKANVGETCATVTWLQLNAQLLRLTGEARYGDELERTYFNHLAAAQHPSGAKWCYYTALQGAKPYGNNVSCCLSSGPRGMALAAQLAYLKYQTAGQDGIAVNLFGASRVQAQLGGRAVAIEQTSDFPAKGGATFNFKMDQPATFAFKVRCPAWAESFSLTLNGGKSAAAGSKGGWCEVAPREWKNGDSVTVGFTIPSRLIAGEHGNTGLLAMTWGPLVLAYDESRNKGLPAAATLALAESADQGRLALTPLAGGELVFQARVRTAPDAQPTIAVFVPFADAGADGGRYQVWMNAVNKPANKSLLSTGRESRSRQGNLNGSINDGEPESIAVTFDNSTRDEDWFAIALDAPVAIKRIVYMHGKRFHDGGWFDASAGKPKAQVQREKNSPWEAIGALDDYPATTAQDSRGLKDGQEFTLRLAEPVKVWGVRIIGKPACGDNPKQAFVSCAELQAFAD
ncbi:MAG: glycoside hydrolase family 127 protein [Candidatus Sumerlaeota bacterium]|nr:glycoside hydrolase family 127 protein [Candidatus Sumerlaeota bacterium]